MRLRTHNKRRVKVSRRGQMYCRKHGVGLIHNGWAFAAGLRFATFDCPAPKCVTFELIPHGIETMSRQELEFF